MAHDPVKVLFITGWDRSGSTLLDLLLNGVDGFFPVGELHYLWQRGLMEGRLCGCGEPLSSCIVWPRILEGVYGGMPGRAEAEAGMRMKAKRLRVRQTWHILRDGGRDLEWYPSLLGSLYREISRVSGARVVVDSSKRPSQAAVLTLLPGVQPYFLHLVRDPRAVAYSMSRRPKPEPDTDYPSAMRQQGPAKSTMGWVVLNVAAERVQREVPRERWMFLRYEDLVAHPQDVIRWIVQVVGEDGMTDAFIDETTAIVETNHTVSGNPIRFTHGKIEIRLDDEWILKQSLFDRSVSTALALPLMRRYDYGLGVPEDRIEGSFP
jgi:hypothetical protein